MGAGKTTFYETYLKEAFPTLVPAVSEHQKAFLNQRRSFAVEDIRVNTQLLDDAKASSPHKFAHFLDDLLTQLSFVGTAFHADWLEVDRSMGIAQADSTPTDTVVV